MKPAHLHLRLLLAGLLLPASAGACNLVLGIEPGKPGGDAGAGGTAGQGGTAGGSSVSSSNGNGGSTSSASGGGGVGGTGGQGGTGGGAPPLLEGNVLLLHLDEASWSGPGAVKDASGEDNHGTVTGTTVPTPDGKLGGAALFDGNGWITVPDAPSLHATTQLTLSVWVYPTGLTDGAAGFPSPGILSKRASFDSNVAYTLFIWDQNNAYVDIQAARFSSTATLANGQWYHLAVVYDGTQEQAFRTRIYVDGALDSVHASDPVLDLNTEDLQIGDLPGGGDRFIGKLDEIAVWTRALDAVEILALYEATRSP